MSEENYEGKCNLRLVLLCDEENWSWETIEIKFSTGISINKCILLKLLSTITAYFCKWVYLTVWIW